MCFELLLWFVVSLSKAKQANTMWYTFACPAIVQGVSIGAAAVPCDCIQSMRSSHKSGTCPVDFMHSLAGMWNGHDIGLIRRSNLSMLGGLCLPFQRHDVLTLESLFAFCWLLPWRSSSKPYKARIFLALA